MGGGKSVYEYLSLVGKWPAAGGRRGGLDRLRARGSGGASPAPGPGVCGATTSSTAARRRGPAPAGSPTPRNCCSTAGRDGSAPATSAHGGGPAAAAPPRGRGDTCPASPGIDLGGGCLGMAWPLGVDKRPLGTPAAATGRLGRGPLGAARQPMALPARSLALSHSATRKTGQPLLAGFSFFDAYIFLATATS